MCWVLSLQLLCESTLDLFDEAWNTSSSRFVLGETVDISSDVPPYGVHGHCLLNMFKYSYKMPLMQSLPSQDNKTHKTGSAALCKFTLELTYVKGA